VNGRTGGQGMNIIVEKHIISDAIGMVMLLDGVQFLQKTVI